MKSEYNKRRTLIILLNWNGSELTHDCCKSLSRMSDETDYDVLIIDNNSQSLSYKLLEEKLSKDFKLEIDVRQEEFDELHKEFAIKKIIQFAMSNDRRIFLARSIINHGFARGCNFGAMLAQKMGYSHILLLNNDTVVEPDFLQKLFIYEPDANLLIPQIRYFEPSAIIWNCGGKVSQFGNRTYFFANENADDACIPVEPFVISFATGCCMLLKTSYYISSGMFTEDFFFGEEDIDYALRLQKLKAKVICVPDSIIYHKVGASLAGDITKLRRKAHIHYLNRFINMKKHLGLLWCIWLIPAILKMAINMKKVYKLPMHHNLLFCLKIIKASVLKNKVEKLYFEKIMTHGY